MSAQAITVGRLIEQSQWRPTLDMVQMAMSAIFNKDVSLETMLEPPEQATVLAFNMLAAADTDTRALIAIFRYFRETLLAWRPERATPMIVSLADNRYAVLISADGATGFDYVENKACEPTAVQAPVLQVSVNLAQLLERS